MHFASDNTSAIAPEILSSLNRASEGYAMPYGNDDLTRETEERIRVIFEAPQARAFLVATGTAANSLALATLCPPWGAIYCHKRAHIETDEANAPEFYSGGAKLTLLGGAHGLIDPAQLEAELDQARANSVHNAQPGALSITQAAEMGAAYTPADLKALTDLAHAAGIPVHMDGTRFANALARQGTSPAEMSWKAGVDVLCLGATKNGAMAVDAIVLFDTSLKGRIEQARKRSGHLHSKHRYLATQLLAYVKNDVWLKNAAHANQAASALADLLIGRGATLAHPKDGNELFVKLPTELAATLRDAGLMFHAWPSLGADVYRFVAAWNTDIAQISELHTTLR